MARTDVAPAAPVAGVRRVIIAGAPTDALTMDGAVAQIDALLRAGGTRRAYVMNANKAWLTARDPELREVFARADLIIPEFATAWAAKRLGIAGVSHVGGLTLMRRLVVEAAARGWSVYLLGAKIGVVSRLAERIRADHPALRLAGFHHGYLDDRAQRRVLDELRTKRPDLLFVALGSPLQERFIAALDEGTAGIALGVGGSFDVLAGVKQDVPVWMRGRGLEWCYRLAQDPRNLWKRYLVTNPWFVYQVMRQRVRSARAATK